MTNNRNKAYVTDAEIAIADVREAVGVLRWVGLKTVAGIHKIAAHCNVTPSRVRTLFYRDQTFLVTSPERRSLALSIADLLDRVADECEAHADRCREKGITIRVRERDQLNLPLLGGNNEWSGSGISQRHRAA